MENNADIENIIKLLDNRTEQGVSRLKVYVSDEVKPGDVDEKYHHGRCDVGSPWARGTVPNFGGCEEM